MLGKKIQSNTQNIFGEILRELRKNADLTQEQLAFEADIERNYVSLIELGRNQPTLPIVFKLAKALNIEPHKIVRMVEKRQTNNGA